MGTTGGWYYQVGIQLPLDVAANDEFNRSPPLKGRHIEEVGELDALGFFGLASLSLFLSVIRLAGAWHAKTLIPVVLYGSHL